jgi:predicted transcriptional regulator
MALDNTPMGKMMVAILSAFAEMERDLISQRTKEGLARVKASGKTLGRPIGARNIKLKTDDIADEIIAMYNDGKQATKICKKFNISPPTFYRFLEKKGIYTPKVIKPLLVDGMYFKDFCKDKGINPTSLIQWCQRGFDSIEDYADHLIKAKEKKQKKSQEIIEEVKQDRARITRTKNSIRLSW